MSGRLTNEYRSKDVEASFAVIVEHTLDQVDADDGAATPDHQR